MEKALTCHLCLARFERGQELVRLPCEQAKEEGSRNDSVASVSDRVADFMKNSDRNLSTVSALDGERDASKQFVYQYSHVFHYDCLQEWLAKNTKCPVCSQDVTLANLDTKANYLGWSPKGSSRSKGRNNTHMSSMGDYATEHADRVDEMISEEDV